MSRRSLFKSANSRHRPWASIFVCLLMVASLSSGCKQEENTPSGEEAIQNAENREGSTGRFGKIPWPPEPIDGSNVATEFVGFQETTGGLQQAKIRIFNFSSEKKLDKLVLQLHCIDRKKICDGGAADGANCETDTDCPKTKKGGGICEEQTLPCPGDGDTPAQAWNTHSSLAIPAQSHNLHIIGLKLNNQIVRVDTTIKEVVYSDQTMWSAEGE